MKKKKKKSGPDFYVFHQTLVYLPISMFFRNSSIQLTSMIDRKEPSPAGAPLANTASLGSIFDDTLCSLLLCSFICMKMGELGLLFPKASVPSGFLRIQSSFSPGFFRHRLGFWVTGAQEGTCRDEHWGLYVSDAFDPRNRSRTTC